MLQHALFSIPSYDDGYCLDDNARALLLMVLLEDAGTDDVATIRALTSRYLAFVSHAFDKEQGRATFGRTELMRGPGRGLPHRALAR